MAGHGVSASSTFCGKYRATEHGLIMGIMSIMPRTMYQQGMDRQWLRRSRYDFFISRNSLISRSRLYLIASCMQRQLRVLIRQYSGIKAAMMRCGQSVIWYVVRCEARLIIGISAVFSRHSPLSTRVLFSACPISVFSRLQLNPVLLCNLRISLRRGVRCLYSRIPA